MLYLFKFASRPTSALSSIISNSFWSDLYHLGLSNDPIYRKALVYGVYAAELVQTILYSKMGYQEYAAGFGDIVALDEIGLLWFAAPVLTALGVYNPYPKLSHFCSQSNFFLKVSFVVQIFYAYRIKVFTQSYIVPFLVALVSFSFSFHRE